MSRLLRIDLAVQTLIWTAAVLTHFRKRHNGSYSFNPRGLSDHLVAKLKARSEASRQKHKFDAKRNEKHLEILPRKEAYFGVRATFQNWLDSIVCAKIDRPDRVGSSKYVPPSRPCPFVYLDTLFNSIRNAWLISQITLSDSMHRFILLKLLIF